MKRVLDIEAICEQIVQGGQAALSAQGISDQARTLVVPEIDAICQVIVSNAAAALGAQKTSDRALELIGSDVDAVCAELVHDAESALRAQGINDRLRELAVDPCPIEPEAICQTLVSNGSTALRAQRVSERMRRLVEPEILSLDDAELHDLNRIVWTKVEEVRPLCRALGIGLVLQQDPGLPAVPLLVSPIEDMLAAALDLCLEDEVQMVRARTRAARDRAVVTIERWCSAGPATDGRAWQEIRPMGSLELIVGDRTARALGGRLRIQRRAADLRVRLELPSGQQPHESRLICSVGAKRMARARVRQLECPGPDSYPIYAV
jgi:hypothetical protein